MRLVLRANAHRSVATSDGCAAVVEVASSPDTPGRRDPWQWHIRLHRGNGCSTESDGAATRRVELGGPELVGVELVGVEPATLEVTVDPAAVRPQVDVVDLTGRQRLDRDERELLALLVSSGSCLVEGRHRLGAGDAMVLEGDDPLQISLAAAGAAPARVAVVRLDAAGESSIGWVP